MGRCQNWGKNSMDRGGQTKTLRLWEFSALRDYEEVHVTGKQREPRLER